VDRRRRLQSALRNLAGESHNIHLGVLELSMESRKEEFWEEEFEGEVVRVFLDASGCHSEHLDLSLKLERRLKCPNFRRRHTDSPILCICRTD
jgi:hypothetical protein